MFTLWILFLTSTFLLYWIYDGYGRFLQLAALLSGRSPFIARSSSESSHPVEMMPSLTALLTVHNEEATIEATLQNLLSCDYPTDRFQILVASDGSTDRTNELIRGYPDPRGQLFESPGLGKTGTQNLAIQSVESDLLLFVDAGVRFEPGFLREIAAQFRDPAVGAVDGRLLYPSDGGTAEVAGQGFYWRYELKLRELESRLGLLAVMTGACMSIRRDLFVEMDPSIGEDCIVPLDIVCQHRRVVHASAARAVDHFEEGAGVTLRRRIRMTLRNWQGT
ncbi:MAG: glycosyltransferase, partial [Planctomycetaceae bacterium]|nr:glycosyltransferase [Planctomycetaceae bacterium]